MKQDNRRFVQFLKIELEDLESDLYLMIDNNQERRERGLITGHVAKENIAVFRNEIAGLACFRNLLDETDPSAFAAIGDLTASIKKQFHELIRTYDFVPAVELYIDRKIGKIMQYISQNP
ncbi:hypothetical protein JW906_12375 [bacterium]|nr:hypothetical protein [bacterium]